MNILLLEDEPAHAEAIQRALEASDLKAVVRVASTLREYREAVAARPPDLALLDLVLPDGRALDLLTSLPDACPFPILIWTSYGNEQTAVEAMKAGALDYIVKSPEAFATMPHAVERALREWNVLQESKRAEMERETVLQRQEGINLLQQSLLMPVPLEQKLKSITDSIVQLFDADFCRIWLIRPGDHCEQGCIHSEVREGPHVCRTRDACLHLLASSGRYTHIDGQGHGRVPFGCYKIGRVASGEDHKFFTNDVLNDPRVHDLEWARELGLVSFAGYQLRIPGGQTMGVLALFAKRPIAPAEEAMLDGLSGTVARVVQQAEGEEALRLAVTSTIRVMGTVVEARDPYTAGHQQKTTLLAEAIAREMGLPPERIEGLRMAGQIHDVGKISIPSEILSKPKGLTTNEFKLVRTHPKKGYEILKNVEFPWPLAEIVYQHHERMDGSGYPRGLKGEDILMEARILAVADTVEAMASDRPYRPALGIEAALAEVEKNKGAFYDANVVETCLMLFKKKGFEFPA